MTDARKFGTPKVLQFGDKTGSNQSGDGGHCAQCEAMLADALDGTLSAADQKFFDAHMAECGPCAQMLADAQRGAAWLGMLRNPAPEPPATLLERILAQTSGTATEMIPLQPAAFAQQPEGVPAMAAGYATPAYGNVLPFPRRFLASSFGQILMQPRLAMTAAMAFFSVALTMNLTGIHPTELRASDLAPSSLERDYHNAKASVVRHYEGLRVVYELESRVHDLQTATDSDAAAGPSAEPIPAAHPQASPNGNAPAAQPDPAAPSKDSPAAQPDRKPASKPAPNSGTSQRESPGRPLYGLARLNVAELDNMNSSSSNANGTSKNIEGGLA